VVEHSLQALLEMDKFPPLVLLGSSVAGGSYTPEEAGVRSCRVLHNVAADVPGFLDVHLEAWACRTGYRRR